MAAAVAGRCCFNSVIDCSPGNELLNVRYRHKALLKTKIFPARRNDPTTDALIRRALALQQEFHLRYSLADVIGKRVTKAPPVEGDLLTDDFAPADLYRVTPIGQERIKLLCQEMERNVNAGCPN